MRFSSQPAIRLQVAVPERRRDRICLNLSGQVFSCLAFFYAGGLAAIARRNSETMSLRSALTMTVAAAVFVSLFCIWHFRLPVAQIDWLLFLVLTPTIVFVLASDIRLPKPCETVIVTAGNMTYSSYLLHFPFQLLPAPPLASRPQYAKLSAT